MELENGPMFAYAAVGAALSAVLYAWLLRIGTKQLFRQHGTKFTAAVAYTLMLFGTLAFATGFGLLASLTYALVFKSADIVLVMFITYGVAVLASTAYVQLHDPKFKKN
jgi:hypothetical protein